MLLRSARAAVFEEPDETTFCDVVFQDREGKIDQRVSVYRLDEDGRLVQLAAEHHAQNGLRLPGVARFFDLAGLGAATPDPILGPKRLFAFVSDAHHEIRHDNDEAVRQMAAGLFQTRAERSKTVNKTAALDYVRGRRANQDGEWVTFCAGPDRAEWNK